MGNWRNDPPTLKQLSCAHMISCALEDNIKLEKMTKGEISDYISESLSDKHKKLYIEQYKMKQRVRRHILFSERSTRRGKPYLSDDSLNADWGLDTCDFGIFPWGDS